ncbi:phosphate/phosphite/phosphonate ABC transporter substrate-binding protein [Tateyamaria sp. syn59]|uniref:phosphate/phosphite/phosphonate ABC transporter substrate-binding protein n=1 Tax=Tateyamaria sp. syn59 TaxID=2576942 RepID=UPI0011BE522A|nr:PhnD/SsuA/transferrin family substrate-binding protein [Tateyamaria sp. syn59]
MIASLGMYDMPHIRGAHDRLWADIRAALGYGPETLTRNDDLWRIWQSPDLLLAQTCGLPYRAKLHGNVALVGTPDYDLPDCPPGHYFSYLIRRREDTRSLKALCNQGIMAFNDGLSQSGWAAPIAHMSPDTPRQTRPTGSHVASLEAVRNGRADYAAVDAVTYLLWADAHPDSAAWLDAFDRTEPTPALPYITAQTRDPAPLADALRMAIARLSPADRSALRLKGLVDIAAAAYLALSIPPAP